MVGLWHQASVVSACLADLGHTVRGVGDDTGVVAGLNQGQAPIYEPGLDEVIGRNLAAGRLRYTTDYADALRGATYAYLAIDTPVGPDDESDLSSIMEAARSIGRALSGPLILMVSAQVPVGTSEQLAELARAEQPGIRLDVVYVPEFLRLGTAIETFRQADRFIIGSDDPAVAERVAALFRPLERPILVTGLRTAEMGKHASNTFLATSISFINEIANLCDEVGADATQVAQILKLDRRIGPYAFLSPGLGFAGGTLGREIRALQKLGQRHGQPTPMMDAVMAVNQSRAQLVGQRLGKVYDHLDGLAVGILGLTYKPGTSTMRRAISLEIIQDLVGQGVSVRAYDPLARLDEVANLPPFEVSPDPYAAAEGADALVLVTEWDGIDDLDFDRLRAAMRRPVLVDTRNLFDPARMRAAGFVYASIGRAADRPRYLDRMNGIGRLP
jgi:UDPglucose 6-dehydrogenase